MRLFWLGGGAVATFLLTYLAFNLAAPREEAITGRMLGHDFIAFYTAGIFVRTGRTGDLYDLDSVKSFQQDLMRKEGLQGLEGDGVSSSFGPWWNPPFYALAFAPLSSLPYSQALSIWRAINLACLAAAIVLLVRMFRAGDRVNWTTWALIPLLILTSSPFIQAVNHGQNTPTSLLILCAAVTLWRRSRPVMAGLIAGLLFYKPQLGAVVALVMVFDLGWRALIGLAITGAAYGAITLICLPSSLERYLHQLPLNVHFMQIENSYLWERHVTLKAMWRLLLQGRAAGEPTIILTIITVTSLAALAVALLLNAWRTRTPKPKTRNPIARDRLITATIIAMPLLMPFYFDYDLLLLAIPAVLMARELRTARLCTLERILTAAWALLFLWAFNNAGFGKWSHVNVSAILLTCIAALTIARLGRKSMVCP